MDVKAGETVKYEVSEELPRIDPFAITKQADWSGFATSLGLDVWTENKRAPEDTFLMQVINPTTLHVTHNLAEAHRLANIVFLLRDGRIRQETVENRKTGSVV